jgi:probable rRNA maturation factor
MSAQVFGYDEQTAVPVDLARWVALAEHVLADEGITTGELTLAFVDEAAMAELNEEHMGEAYATDVLSFPLDADLAGAVGDMRGDDDGVAPVLLGDVVVCPGVAAVNAPEHAGTFDDEVALLVVHGVLHVLGHDHAAQPDTAQMHARERELLERHHWHGAAPATFGAHRDQAQP